MVSLVVPVSGTCCGAKIGLGETDLTRGVVEESGRAEQRPFAQQAISTSRQISALARGSALPRRCPATEVL